MPVRRYNLHEMIITASYATFSFHEYMDVCLPQGDQENKLNIASETSLRRRTVTVNHATRRIANLPTTSVIVALLALALLPACQRAQEEAAPEIRPVRVTTIENRSASGTVSLTGTVQAQTEINQAFRIDGRLIERTVDIGDSVKPGQLVARFMPSSESGTRTATE